MAFLAAKGLLNTSSAHDKCLIESVNVNNDSNCVLWVYPAGDEETGIDHNHM